MSWGGSLGESASDSQISTKNQPGGAFCFGVHVAFFPHVSQAQAMRLSLIEARIADEH
jgi:hypothetical protein